MEKAPRRRPEYLSFFRAQVNNRPVTFIYIYEYVPPINIILISKCKYLPGVTVILDPYSSMKLLVSKIPGDRQ